MRKKIDNRLGARTHPCLTSLAMGKLSDSEPLCLTCPNWPSWGWRRMVNILGGKPRCARIFHNPSLLTVSKALVRSMESAFCFLYFSWIRLSVSARRSYLWYLSVLARNHAHTGFLACFSQQVWERACSTGPARARIFPGMDSSVIPPQQFNSFKLKNSKGTQKAK